MGSKLWKGQKHYLNKMTLADLVAAYFAYPAIQAYLSLTAVSIGLTLLWAKDIGAIVLSVGAAVVIYGLVWYLLHRFILHGQFLYKSPRTAALWKRIHFDHHQDPNDLGVLFGALHTTLPTIFFMTVPIGWLIGGPAGGAAAFAAGLVTTCYYEFCHCIQHLAYTPKWAFLRRIKKLHLAHHFHNEQGNYGITNFFWDRLAGTYYPSTNQVPRSATVFNLGYVNKESEQFPWVAELSGANVDTDPGCAQRKTG
ncbi:MAG: sterol desaturase family protein [Nitrospinales bacterium]